ncbi:outer membrane protein assembly factor BamB family protein [Chitiniphilus eburneus]|nr:PQQ-binding-like beta-propeller repeat protein [Chitiniphilus eburneus]
MRRLSLSLLFSTVFILAPVASAAPGAVQWQLDTGAPVRAAPLLVGDTLIVGNADGMLRGLDWPSRKPRWQQALKGSLGSQPTHAGDRIYVQTNRQVYALSVKDGRILWQRDLGDQGDWRGFKLWDTFQGSPVVHGDRLLVAFGDSLYALALADGATRWRYESAYRLMATPTVVGDKVLIADGDGQLSAVALATGKALWRKQPGRDTIQTRIAVWNKLGIYGSRDAAVHAFDLNTGKEAWRASHDTSWVVGSALVQGDVAYIGSSDGLFFQALDAASGRELWRVDTGQNAFTAPVYANGQLLLATGDAYQLDRPGRVTAVGLDGKRHWQAELPAGLFGQPIVVGDTLMVGAENGRLYGVSLR